MIQNLSQNDDLSQSFVGKKRSKPKRKKFSERIWEKWENLSEEIPESIQAMMTSVGLNLNNTNSFCSDGWNILDGIVVCFSLISLFFRLNVWRTLRALRLFRVVIRSSKMRNILLSVKKGMPFILSAFFFAALIYFILAVVGLNLFFADYNRCSCNALIVSLLPNQAQCLSHANGGLSWVNGGCVCNNEIVKAMTETDCVAGNGGLVWASSYFRFILAANTARTKREKNSSVLCNLKFSKTDQFIPCKICELTYGN